MGHMSWMQMRRPQSRMYHTCTVTCTVHLYCTVHCTHQHGLGHGGPDYDQPGAAGQVQQRRDVPAQRGRHQVPHNVLRAVTLSLDTVSNQWHRQ